MWSSQVPKATSRGIESNSWGRALIALRRFASSSSFGAGPGSRQTLATRTPDESLPRNSRKTRWVEFRNRGVRSTNEGARWEKLLSRFQSFHWRFR